MVVTVATAVVKHQDKEKFLLAKRTTDTDIQPGKWNFPGGKIEAEDSAPEEAAKRELREETGLNEQPGKVGENFIVDTVDGKFRVHPVLFRTSTEPDLNPEHTEYRWIKPEELEKFDTVKGLKQDLENVDVI